MSSGTITDVVIIILAYVVGMILGGALADYRSTQKHRKYAIVCDEIDTLANKAVQAIHEAELSRYKQGRKGLDYDD